MLGTIQSALVLGHARDTHLEAYISNPLQDKESVTSGSSMMGRFLFDLGPSTRGPRHWTLPLLPLEPPVAAWPKATSRVLRVSCVRPSVCRSSWSGTPHVHDTVTVLSSDPETAALGSAFGSREHMDARAWEAVRACDELRSAIVGVDHASTEMVLTRQCVDTPKLMNHMRINDDSLDHELLTAFDGQSRASVSASLCGDLPDHSWWQATTGVTCRWAFARRSASRYPLLSPAASCAVLWLPPWSTTDAPLPAL